MLKHQLFNHILTNNPNTENNENNNLLNVSEIKSKKHKNNVVDINKLFKILKSKMNNNFSKISYLGMGIGGDLYKIKSSDKNYYICKCFSNNDELRKKINEEISIIRMIQNHNQTKFYILPCFGININRNNIVCLFPNFDGINLNTLLDTVFDPKFGSKSRNIILKYLIKEMIIGLHLIHKRNIAHMNISHNSILIETNDININSSNERSVVKNSVSTTVPTNQHIYIPYFEEKDKILQVKFTNFGNSIGKVVKTNINDVNLNNLNINEDGYIFYSNNKKMVIDILNKDYFISKYLKNKKRVSNSQLLKLGQLYDICCLGKIILSIIIKQNVLNSNTSINEINPNHLIDDDFKDYFNFIKKYMIVSLGERKKLKFIRDSIILNEKHN